MTSFIISFAAGATALVFAIALVIYILRQDEGNELMREIGKAIQEGAMAFLKTRVRRPRGFCPDHLCGAVDIH